MEPGSGSPQRLAREKPFLFRAIMLAAAPAGKARAEAMHRELLAEMGARMMLEEEGVLDLLQGMLVIILWLVFNPPPSIFCRRSSTLCHVPSPASAGVSC